MAHRFLWPAFWIFVALFAGATVYWLFTHPDYLTWEFWQSGRNGEIQSSRSEVVRNLGLLAIGVIGLGFGIWRAWLASKHQRSIEEGQITDRFSKAVEQLGSSHINVRLGAIHSLWRIAEDSPEREYIPVVNLLCGFLRGHAASELSPVDQNSIEAPSDRLGPSADVVSVINLMKQRSDRFKAIERALPKTDRPINLSGVNLSGMVLSGIDLSNADLTNAVLTKTDLTRAKLNGTDLSGALIDGADVVLADLRGAKCNRASLRKVNFWETDLRGARLTKADAREASFLETKLESVNFRDARLKDANLSRADFGSKGPINLTDGQLVQAYAYVNERPLGLDLAGLSRPRLVDTKHKSPSLGFPPQSSSSGMSQHEIDEYI